ncbi:MAG TPA: hypothetical protein VF092_21960 [Longimicrobium sp.]
MAATFKLALISEMGPDVEGELSHDLQMALRETGAFSVSMDAPADNDSQTKGVEELGHLVISFLSGAGGLALIRVIRSYIERDRTIKIKLQRKDGAKLELNANNLAGSQVTATLSSLERFLE